MARGVGQVELRRMLYEVCGNCQSACVSEKKEVGYCDNPYTEKPDGNRILQKRIITIYDRCEYFSDKNKIR